MVWDLTRGTRHIDGNTVIVHNCGFFSCCSVRLGGIVDYFNTYKSLPKNVDSSRQFLWYKTDQREDVTFKFFEHYDNVNIDIEYVKKVDYHDEHQNGFYKDLDFESINPFIKKYFSPSKFVKYKIYKMTNKYNIDFENTCALFHRGHDKHTEQVICTHEEKLEKARKVLEKNPSIRFLIQSDETEFIEKAISAFPNNSFYCKDEIYHMPHDPKGLIDYTFKENSGERAENFLAVLFLMSKCKYIISSAANCDIWTTLLRGHSNNLIQYYKGEWCES
jgi:hypothetical protein